MSKFNLSKELKYKIKTTLALEFGYWFVDFDLGEAELYNECKNWYKATREFNYPTIYLNLCKTNIGRFHGVLPEDIYGTKIYFSVDYCEDKSYKDWFIVE